MPALLNLRLTFGVFSLISLKARLKANSCFRLIVHTNLAERRAWHNRPVRSRAPQFTPRTRAHGSGVSDGMKRSRRNHDPGALVAIWKATRSPITLMGNSKSFGPGE